MLTVQPRVEPVELALEVGANERGVLDQRLDVEDVGGGDVGARHFDVVDAAIVGGVVWR